MAAPMTYRSLTRLPPENALTREQLAALAAPRPPARPYRTVADVLDSSPLDLAEACGWPPDVADEVARKASRATCPEPRTVRSVLAGGVEGRGATADKPQFFRTGLRALDERLRGGIPCGSITEFVGPSGCGKTQICTTLAVLATLPKAMGGLDGGVAYIDTEGAFRPQRLLEIARTRFPEHFNSTFPADLNSGKLQAAVSDDMLKSLSDSVHILRATSLSELAISLGSLQELIIGQRVRLVVVDSIAALVRKESEFKVRNDLLSKQAALLKYIAESFWIPIVVTNQVATRSSKAHVALPEEDDAASAQITAALGNTWSHSVNTRLVLEFAERGYQPSILSFFKQSCQNSVNYIQHRVRNLRVAKSPVAPPALVQFTITQKGFAPVEGPAQNAVQGSAGR